MSADKGKRAGAWLARYLQTQGWTQAEAVPNGRAGMDILGTPGVSIELKTGVTWRESWLKQAAKYAGRIKLLVYMPPGCGEASIASAQAIVPLHVMMQLLREAGYLPSPGLHSSEFEREHAP